MSRLSLKNIIGRSNDATAMLNSLIQRLHATIWIEDTAGRILLNSKQDLENFTEPIEQDGELLGWVKGDQNTTIISEVIRLLLQKEAERKKLGSEVLNLYQEVNMMFDFSERLAQTIEVNSIAEVTLSEASRVIRATNGVVALWDEATKQLRIAASIGELFFDADKINTQLAALRNIVFSGQSEIIDDVTELKKTGIVLPQVQSVIYSAIKVKHRIMGAIILAKNETVHYTAGDLKLLTTLALQSSVAIESAFLYEENIRRAQEREEAMRRIYEVTNKFVPFEFIKSLGYEVITDVRLGDQTERIVTVLFSDIREFTTISEKMTPEENFSFICSFNERIGPIIRRHGGFINQYLGDAIMAIFPGNASDALMAAIEMQQDIQEFNTQRLLQNKSAIQIGIGMHTGPLIMGITGDKDRLDACTISDTVNTASRIESLTKHYKASILLSDASLAQMPEKENFLLRSLGMVQLKGKQVTVTIHECFNGNPGHEAQKKLQTLSLFNEAISHYLNKSFTLANNSFKKVIDDHPDDRTAKFFFSYTKEIIENGSQDNKAGVVEMNEK